MIVLAVAFAFSLPQTPLQYNVKIEFDGYLPVLGGSEGKVIADIGMTVKGEGMADDGNHRASSDLTSLNLVWNGDKMPFTVDNVRPFFPKTNIVYASNGKIVKSDAPDVQLPVRLPGLDVKRFPDITYLPVVFPDTGLVVGELFQFTKSFGDSDVKFDVTPVRVEGSTVILKVQMTQSYETMEDEARNLTKDEKDAYYRVKTAVRGDGEFVLDSARGILVRSKLVGVSQSSATEIKSSKTSERKLTTTLSVTLTK